jgi:hypothetical protein
MVSATELHTILDAARVRMSADEVAQLMKDADTDHSGEVSFEELFIVLKKDLDNGGIGPWSNMVSHVASVFSWFNPVTWGQQQADTGSRASQRRRPASVGAIPPPGSESATAAAPKASNTAFSFFSLGAQEANAVEKSRARASSVRSQRSVFSEWMAISRNAQVAEEKRQEDRVLRATRKSYQDHFLERQQKRIGSFKQQRVDTSLALEALKSLKREVGHDMRERVQTAWHQTQSNNQHRAALVSGKALEARRVKEAETAARKEEQRRNATMIAIKAKDERRRRREESLATVRAQEQAAKDFAAQVRFETRPDVRRETRDFFQAKRNAVYSEERDKQAQDRRRRGAENERFLAMTARTVGRIKEVDVHAQEARRKVAEKRHCEAEEVRQLLQSEKQRQRESTAQYKRELYERHDAVMRDRFDPSHLDEEWAAQLRDSPTLRQSLKARSRAWQGHDAVSMDMLLSS